MTLQGPDPGERPGSGRPAAARAAAPHGALRRFGLPAVAVVALGAFGFAIWTAYGRNAPGEPGFEPPLIRADGKPTKFRPDDPGGWRAPHEDKLVYQAMNPAPPAPGAERLLPAPEAPMAKPTPPPAPPPLVPEASVEPARAVEVGETQAVPLPGQGGAAAPPPAASGPQQLAPPPGVVAAPQAETMQPLEPAKPVEAAKPAEPPKPLPPPVAAAAPGAYRLQLAAFQERAQAEAMWRKLQQAHQPVLGALHAQIVAADLGTKGTWYRLQAAGLNSESAARAACDLLKTRKQDCLVVKPG